MEPTILISSTVEAAKACQVDVKVQIVDSESSHFSALGEVTEMLKQRKDLSRVIIFVKNTRDGRQLHSLLKSVAVHSEMVGGSLLSWQVQELAKRWADTSSRIVLIVTEKATGVLLQHDVPKKQGCYQRLLYMTA